MSPEERFSYWCFGSHLTQSFYVTRFWCLFFQANLIIINHLVKGGLKTFNKSKFNHVQIWGMWVPKSVITMPFIVQILGCDIELHCIIWGGGLIKPPPPPQSPCVVAMLHIITVILTVRWPRRGRIHRKLKFLFRVHL